MYMAVIVLKEKPKYNLWEGPSEHYTILIILAYQSFSFSFTLKTYSPFEGHTYGIFHYA